MTLLSLTSDAMTCRTASERAGFPPGCGRSLVVLWLVVAVVAAAGRATALAQESGAKQPAAVEDDPFADELNPFGGKKKPPAKPSTPPAPTPGIPAAGQEGPDAALPPLPKPSARDAGAESPAVPPKPDMPSPPIPAKPKPPVQLPVPFPEATAPREPAAGRGGRPAPRTTMDEDELRPGAGQRESWEPSPGEQLLAEAEKLDATGDLQGARKKILEAIKADPKLTIAYVALGSVARRLGDFAGSVDACSKGLIVDPDEAELYLRRGIAWFHMGLHGIALEDFEEASGIAYDDPRPELWRGLTLMELDRPLEAINAYASAIRRDRGFTIGYLNRGLAYLQIDQPRKAEFDFNQAIRQDPRDARAWFNRGVAQARQGRFTEAVHSYEEALKCEPGMESARRNLAAARSMGGSR